VWPGFGLVKVETALVIFELVDYYPLLEYARKPCGTGGSVVMKWMDGSFLPQPEDTKYALTTRRCGLQI
jgi:hypothetical protein